MKDTINDLSKQSDLYRIIARKVKDTITVWDMEFNLIYASPSLEAMLGYREEELKSLFNKSVASGFECIVAPESIDTFLQDIGKGLRKLREVEHNEAVEARMIRKDGSTVWTETSSSSLMNDDGQRVGILSITRDISNRKHTRDILKKNEERYRNILESIDDGYLEFDLAGKFTFFNEALCRMTGFSREELMGMSSSKCASPETAEKLRTTFNKIYATGEDARIKEYEIVRKDGSMRINDLSASIMVDASGSPVGFRGVVRDVTEHVNKEQELKDSYASVQRMLEETVRTLAFTVEVRDPYTAGHQRRVAQLAEAISERIGLTPQEIMGIKMAALIHDVGKVQIPGEILSKPGPINSNEMDLVRTHPEVGSNILKEIQFPWPISDIILQHHGRLDGSGYPKGVDDSDMSIGARIIAVADVVEAMVSHRPYRSALGMAKAIEEISNNKGTLYDEKVVDVCLSLFNEEGFAFS